MPDKHVVAWVRDKYRSIIAELDERGRRRWAAVEARSLGWGGIAAVSLATGISDRTIRNGIAEIAGAARAGADRQRSPGGGRRSREEERPDIFAALDSLVDPTVRGDPMSPLRWICKSTRALARELVLQGFAVSSTKVGGLLKSQGYSLQSNRKTVEGKQHPDRDAQFEFIAGRVRARRRRGEPAISIDTKKKEPLGNLKNPGGPTAARATRRGSRPTTSRTRSWARRSPTGCTTSRATRPG